MNTRQLKFAFIIIAPVVVLFFIIMTNFRSNNNNTDNLFSNPSLNPTEALITPVATGDIVAQLISYNESSKTITAYLYDIYELDCSVYKGPCQSTSLINKRAYTFNYDTTTIFYVNKKSLTKCTTNENGAELVPLDFSNLNQSKCDYFKNGELFLIINQKGPNLTFREYPFNTF